MTIERTELKGLARILGILLIWMSLGWAMFPTLMEDVAIAANETLDMQEVELFSTIMLAACLIIGIILLAYGYIGRRKTSSAHDTGMQAPKGQ